MITPRKLLASSLAIFVLAYATTVFWNSTVGQWREGVGPRQSTLWNLKDLGNAMHQYHDQHGRLPPAAVFGKDGTPLLSWRVLLLPYIEQGELFREFKLDEPWDSRHNLKLLQRIPTTYSPVEGSPPYEPNTTFYQVFVGKWTAFEGREGLRFKDFGARMSNTFLIVEAGKAVPWTKPEDLSYDESKPIPKLGGLREGMFLATFLDVSARWVPHTTREATLRAAIVRNGAGPGEDW